MTASLPVSGRTLAAIGIALLVACFLLVLRPVLGSGGSSTSSPPVTRIVPATTPKPVAKPAVRLLPGLPAGVAARLRKDPVVVVSVYSGTSTSDRNQVGVAREGARTAGAAFLALNVLDENRARDVSNLIGTIDVPATAVVRRPGTVVTVLPGTVDSALVEQAAHNAGARR